MVLTLIISTEKVYAISLPNNTQKVKIKNNGPISANKNALAVSKMAEEADLVFRRNLSAEVTMVEPPIDYDQYDTWLDSRYSLLSHKGTYLLPFSYNWNPDQSLYAQEQALAGNNHDFYQKTEAEIQISFMVPIYRNISRQNWDLFFAYTHHAWWQLYNASWSKPFRETNYIPELFMRRLDRTPWRIFGFDLLGYDLGFVHESNGQIQLLSRSWDRAFTRGYFRGSENVFFIISGWLRFPEEKDNDDNSDILKYMGVGDFEIYYRIHKHSLSLRVPLSSHPGVELKYSRSWTRNVRWFMNYRFGYGHSLIEYNREVQRIGIGVSLESFLDRNDEFNKM